MVLQRQQRHLEKLQVRPDLFLQKTDFQTHFLRFYNNCRIFLL